MDTLGKFKLENKVVVVTGGFGQLGQQFTAACADSGGRVAVIDIADMPDNVIADFRNHYDNGTIRSYKGDITDSRTLQDILSRIKDRWESPTVLINASALDSPPGEDADENGPFENYPEASLDKILNVNIKGTFLCCQVFGGEMAKSGTGGSIINIGSIYGIVSPNQNIYEYKRKSGGVWFKPAAYSVSKSAILNLTRYLATYWAKAGIRVNTISPSGIFNNQDDEFLMEYCKHSPLGRMADADEINGAIVYLASDASSYTTGTNIIVDGGWTAW